MASEEEWMEKHQDMEGEGKKPGNSPSEEVKGHWTPTGYGPKELSGH